MKKKFICYVDFDGVLNLFDSDENARSNMWKQGYFLNIPAREGMSDLLMRINTEAYVIIISKVIDRIGVVKEKNLWLENNISPNAYSDIIYVPYSKSKAEYVRADYSSMLLDDNEANITECEKKGCYGIFLSDIKVSQRYPNVRNLQDIWNIYQELVNKL